MKIVVNLASIFICTALLLLPEVSLAQTAVTPAERQRMLVPENLAEIEDSLDDIRNLLNEIDKADANGGLFTKGKADYQAKLDNELDGLLDALTGAQYGQSKQKLSEIDSEISVAEANIDRLKSDLRLAPVGDGEASLTDRLMMRKVATGSENALKAEIQVSEDSLEKSRQNRTVIIDNFIVAMDRKFNFRLTTDQAIALLYQVNGQSIVQSKIIFEILTTLEQYLAEGLDSQSSPAAIQRYYSVSAVARLMLVRMYEQHLQEYDERWLPRLKEIEAENDRLMATTSLSAKQASTSSQKEQFKNNLRIQSRTKEAIQVYHDRLESRRENSLRGLKLARGEADVAINTLKTLDGVFALSSEMLSNDSEYEALMSLNTPDVLPLDGEILDENYILLSEKLNGS